MPRRGHLTEEEDRGTIRALYQQQAQLDRADHLLQGTRRRAEQRNGRQGNTDKSLLLYLI